MLRRMHTVSTPPRLPNPDNVCVIQSSFGVAFQGLISGVWGYLPHMLAVSGGPQAPAHGRAVGNILRPQEQQHGLERVRRQRQELTGRRSRVAG